MRTTIFDKESFDETQKEVEKLDKTCKNKDSWVIRMLRFFSDDVAKESLKKHGFTR